MNNGPGGSALSQPSEAGATAVPIPRSATARSALSLRAIVVMPAVAAAVVALAYFSPQGRSWTAQRYSGPDVAAIYRNGIRLSHPVDLAVKSKTDPYAYEPTGELGFEDFSTGHDDAPIAPIYVRLRDGQKYYLPVFHESVAAEILDPPRDKGGDLRIYMRGWWQSNSSMHYERGKLTYASLHGSTEQFAIALREDGPYYTLPIERNTALQLFGEPVRWEKLHWRGGGP